MSLEFQLANHGDIDALEHILNDAKRIKEENGDDAWSQRAFTPKEIGDMLADPGQQIFIGYDGDTPVTSLALTEQDERIWGAQGLDGTALYVHKLARVADSKGAGTEGMAFAERLARKLGKPFLRLDNPEGPLDDYYESLGYEPVGARDLGSYQPVLREKAL